MTVAIVTAAAPEKHITASCTGCWSFLLAGGLLLLLARLARRRGSGAVRASTPGSVLAAEDAILRQLCWPLISVVGWPWSWPTSAGTTLGQRQPVEQRKDDQPCQRGRHCQSQCDRSHLVPPTARGSPSSSLDSWFEKASKRNAPIG